MAEDRVLLEHRDLPAWFAQPRPPRNDVTSRRQDLGDLLMNDSIAAALFNGPDASVDCHGLGKRSAVNMLPSVGFADRFCPVGIGDGVVSAH